ncbi:unnamed protein product [Discula destructiva]
MSTSRSSPNRLPTSNLAVQQKAVAGAVASVVGTGPPAVLARIYHRYGADHVPRKLTKKRPILDLKACILAPLPLQRSLIPAPARGPSCRLNEENRTPAGSQCKSAMAPKMTETRTLTNQVRPTNVLPNGHAGMTDTVARRSAASKPLSKASVLTAPTPQHPHQHKSVAEAFRSGIPGPSQSSAALQPGGSHPNPLRSNPPQAVTRGPASVRPARVSRIMGKRYGMKLNQMTILPTLSEATGENLPPSPPPLEAPATGRNATTALPLSPSPRPSPHVDVPEPQRSQTQQLEDARDDPVKAANALKAENVQLYSDLQELVSQRIIAVTQIEQLKRHNRALETALEAMREQLEQLSSGNVTNKSPQPTSNQGPHMAAVEQKLAQQAQRLTFYKRSDAASRGMVGALVNENKHMETRLDKAEAERSRLRKGLDAAEGKLQRIERSLYVYPSSTTQELVDDSDTRRPAVGWKCFEKN